MVADLGLRNLRVGASRIHGVKGQGIAAERLVSQASPAAP
jgi:hypothetical protein